MVVLDISYVAWNLHERFHHPGLHRCQLNVTGPRGPGPQRQLIHRFYCLAVSDTVGRTMNLRLAKHLGWCPRSCHERRHKKPHRLLSRWKSTVPRWCHSCVLFLVVGGGRVCLYRCRFHASPTGTSSRLLFGHLRSRPSSIRHPPGPGRPPSA